LALVVNRAAHVFFFPDSFITLREIESSPGGPSIGDFNSNGTVYGGETVFWLHNSQ
jgi:hypothetical protein